MHHVGGLAGDEVFGQVHLEPVQEDVGVPGGAVVDAVLETRQGQYQVEGADRHGRHVRQRAPDGREPADRLSERPAVDGVGRRLQVGPAHHAGVTDRGHPPAGVEDDGHRRPEPVLDGADGPRQGAVEVDLARRQAAGAELVLEAAQCEAVRRAVDLAGDHETAEPPCPGARAVDAGGEEELARVGHRAEPLLPRDAIRAVALRHGTAHVRPYVGTALDLGEELRPAHGGRVGRIHQGWEEALADAVVGHPTERPGQADGAGRRARMTGLPFEGEQVQQGGLLECRARGPRQRDEPARPHGTTGDVVGGVERHRLGPPADAVVAGELGQVGPLLVAHSSRADDTGHVQGERGRPFFQPCEAPGWERPGQCGAQVPVAQIGILREVGPPGGQGTACGSSLHGRSFAPGPRVRQGRATRCPGWPAGRQLPGVSMAAMAPPVVGLFRYGSGS